MKRVCMVFLAAVLAAACGSYATTGWIAYKNPPTEKDIYAVTFINADDGWAVGYWGEILRYRDGKWTINYTWPTQFLQDISFGGTNFGLAVGYQGNGAVYNGTKWSVANTTTTHHVYGVAIPPGQSQVAWAVGDRGDVFRWTGGNKGSWSRWEIGTLATLHDIYFSSQTDGWLCGSNGRIYHFTGDNWSPVNAATTTTFFTIFAISEDNVWVAGAGGQIYHYEGVSWVRVSTPITANIREMAFTGPTSGWAVCDGGIVLHYDGVNWKQVNTNPKTTESFSGLYMLDAQNGWAVGTKGTIYEYRNFPGVAPASLGKVKALMR